MSMKFRNFGEHKRLTKERCEEFFRMKESYNRTDANQTKYELAMKLLFRHQFVGI